MRYTIQMRGPEELWASKARQGNDQKPKTVVRSGQVEQRRDKMRNKNVPRVKNLPVPVSKNKKWTWNK